MANDTDPSNRIEEWLAIRGMNQAQLARAVHADPATINKLIKGARGLDQHWMRRLSAALDCAPADLLPPADNPYGLSDDERLLIEQLRAADPHQRAVFDRVAVAMLARGDESHAG